MEKLTEYQNMMITETLCEILKIMLPDQVFAGCTADTVKEARCILVSECEEINLRSRHGCRANRKTSQ